MQVKKLFKVDTNIFFSRNAFREDKRENFFNHKSASSINFPALVWDRKAKTENHR